MGLVFPRITLDLDMPERVDRTVGPLALNPGGAATTCVAVSGWVRGLGHGQVDAI